MKTLITAEDKSFINFKELQGFFGLLKYLSLRDILVRYKQTWMGFAWSIVRPLINIFIFGTLSMLISKNSSTENFVRVGCGIIFWQLISTVISDSSNSLSANANILTKVYFPKLILPLSTLFPCLVDFLISFILFFICVLFYQGISWHIIFLPLIILHSIIFSLGIGLIFSVASVKYRDVKFILPFIIQILFYASPVFLSSSDVLQLNIPEWLKIVYQLNPLLHIIDAYKFCMLGNNAAHINLVYYAGSIFVTLILCFLAVRYFLKFEKTFADYI